MNKKEREKLARDRWIAIALALAMVIFLVVAILVSTGAFKTDSRTSLDEIRCYTASTRLELEGWRVTGCEIAGWRSQTLKIWVNASVTQAQVLCPEISTSADRVKIFSPFGGGTPLATCER